MADIVSAFRADVEGALRLVIGALHAMGSATPQGVHPNVARAAALLDDPNPPAESPDPQSSDGVAEEPLPPAPPAEEAQPAADPVA